MTVATDVLQCCKQTTQQPNKVTNTDNWKQHLTKVR